MDKNIVFIHRRRFEERPPVISVVQYLTELGAAPHVITAGLNDHYRNEFKEKGIPYTVIPFSISKGHFVKNVLNGFIWGIKARREINKLARRRPIVLWVEGNYTFDSLSARFINKFPHILQHQELPGIFTKKGRYTVRTLKHIIPTALANMAPEYNRTWVYTDIGRLSVPPFLLPNKPSFIPSREQILQLKEKYRFYDNLIGNRKIILYQGILSAERDLSNFALAAGRLDSKEFVFVLLGRKTSLVDHYKEINPELVHIDYIPAPDYLYLTSMAYIGIVSYNPHMLNTAFCAPNKIYEYGAFGVPMIGNDIPGLRNTIVANNCGVVCDDKSVDSIYEALNTVILHYELYSKNAREFFDSTDNKATIAKILERIA